MQNYAKDSAKYYDLVHHKKDYLSEVLFLERVWNDYRIKKVLDVGCGTGNHSVMLAKKNPKFSFFGIDMSKDMIDIAKSKSSEVNNVQFHNVSIQNFHENNFNAIISMFYVINHILSLSELISFFKDMRKKLAVGGVLIFDCWNGIASVRDLPKTTTRTRYTDSALTLKTTCVPEIDLFNSFIKMKNKVELLMTSGEYHFYNEVLCHVMWSPKIIKEVLNIAGFKTVDCYKTYEFKQCNENDFKIIFVCK